MGLFFVYFFEAAHVNDLFEFLLVKLAIPRDVLSNGSLEDPRLLGHVEVAAVHFDSARLYGHLVYDRQQERRLARTIRSVEYKQVARVCLEIETGKKRVRFFAFSV